MDNLSFINIIIGIALIIFIFFNKHNLGKNVYAKLAIIGVISIFTLSALSDYLMTLGATPRYSIFTYIALLVSHLIGFFLLLFVSAITGQTNHLKTIIITAIGVTVVRALLIYSLITGFLIKQDASNIDNLAEANAKLPIILANTDEFIMAAFNLILTIIAYKTLKKAPLIVDLGSSKALYYKWGKIILVFSIVLYTIVLLNTVLLSFNRDNLTHILFVEKILKSIFFIFLIISMMYFPVFAYSGKYEDLPSLYEVDKEKYKGSTLIDSLALFNEIDTLVRDEKLYLDSELKMDKVSKKLARPIPHISQAINENTQNSFPDYINSFRIEEAKKKLLVENPDTIFAIAIDIGFNNKTTFYNAFKKYTDMTPTQYRKQFRKEKDA